MLEEEESVSKTVLIKRRLLQLPFESCHRA